MPEIITRYLLTAYRLQQVNVKWYNEVSKYFKIGNGVKQGAVLSCDIYTVFILIGLFEKLRRMIVGCSIEQSYTGIVGYADDLFLMCPTLDGLQKMLVVCEDYDISHNSTF